MGVNTAQVDEQILDADKWHVTSLAVMRKWKFVSARAQVSTRAVELVHKTFSSDSSVFKPLTLTPL
jgi:hypothetical protein